MMFKTTTHLCAKLAISTTYRPKRYAIFAAQLHNGFGLQTNHYSLLLIIREFGLLAAQLMMTINAKEARAFPLTKSGS
jgi:hypothetical protein